MADLTDLPDLVRDGKLVTTRCDGRVTIHEIPDVAAAAAGYRPRPREERWERATTAIGRGGFGTVWREGRRDRMDKQPTVERAVKEIKITNKRIKRSDYLRELVALMKFSQAKYNQCFVKSHGWYEQDDSLFIAMEYLAQGDLQAYIDQKRHPLTEAVTQALTFQLVEGLCFMHSEGFAHRDFKPANILIVNSPPHQWWVKISDFGLSKRHLAEQGTDASGFKGTPAFAAPELLGFNPRILTSEADALAADIWALGETIFQLLTKRRTFKDVDALRSYVSGPSQFPSNILQRYKISNHGEEFVRSCMEPQPDARRPAMAAAMHPWIAEPGPYKIRPSESSKPYPSNEAPTFERAQPASSLPPAREREVLHRRAPPPIPPPPPPRVREGMRPRDAPIRRKEVPPIHELEGSRSPEPLQSWQSGGGRPYMIGALPLVPIFESPNQTPTPAPLNRVEAFVNIQRKPAPVSPGSSFQGHRLGPDTPNRWPVAQYPPAEESYYTGDSYASSRFDSQSSSSHQYVSYRGTDSIVDSSYSTPAGEFAPQSTTYDSLNAPPRPLPHHSSEYLDLATASLASSDTITPLGTMPPLRDEPHVIRKKQSVLEKLFSRNAFQTPYSTVEVFGSNRSTRTEVEVRLLKPGVMRQSSTDSGIRIMKHGNDGTVGGEMSNAGAQTYLHAASTGGVVARSNVGRHSVFSPVLSGPNRHSAPPSRRANKHINEAYKHAAASMATLNVADGEQQSHARVMMSVQGDKLMTLSQPDRLEMWEASTGAHDCTMKLPPVAPSTAILSSFGDLLIFAYPKNLGIHIYNLKKKRLERTMYCEAIKLNELEGFVPTRIVLALQPGENVLVAMHIWHRVKAFSREMKTFVTFFDMMTHLSLSTIPIPATVNLGTDDNVTDIDLVPYMCPTADSPDHFFGAAYTASGESIILTVRREVFLVDPVNHDVRPVLASPDNLLVSAFPLSSSNSKITFVAIAPNRYGQATLIRLWSTSPGSSVKTLTHPSTIVGFALSSGGTFLLTLLSNLMLVLWDVNTSRPLLRATTERQFSLRFPPEFSSCGRFFITYHSDACRLWRVPGPAITKARRDDDGWRGLGFLAEEERVGTPGGGAGRPGGGAGRPGGLEVPAQWPGGYEVPRGFR